jgi:hypothetical protein
MYVSKDLRNHRTITISVSTTLRSVFDMMLLVWVSLTLDICIVLQAHTHFNGYACRSKSMTEAGGGLNVGWLF